MFLSKWLPVSTNTDSAFAGLSPPKLKYRLSYKLAINAVAVAFTIGLLLTSGQIFLDYFSEKQLMRDDVSRALSTAKESASLAAFNLDESAALQITKGLASNLSIKVAKVSDNFGNVLGESKQQGLPVSWLSRRLFGEANVLVNELYVDESATDGQLTTLHVGTLLLVVDPALTANAFIERSVFSLVLGILRNFFLALAIILVFYFSLTRSLLSASSRVRESELLTPIPIPENHESDELGVLFEAFNKQLETINSQHRKIVDARDGLEKTVQQRTAQLDTQNQTLKLQREVAESASQSKSDFLAMMSHEVRTPMNGILGLAHLLAETKLDTRQAEFVDAVVDASESLLTLMNNALDYSRSEARALDFQFRSIDLERTMQSVVFLMSSSAEKNGTSISLNMDDDICLAILTDAERLRQVLLNLISNAVKFTYKGQIDINVKLMDCGEDFQYLRFEVNDSGIGIASSAQQKIFSPYQQADESIRKRYGGSGMGLAISKAIVEQQGGVIGLNSEVGQGAQFWFEMEFALATGLSNQEMRSVHHHAVDQSQPKKLLVADDVELNRNLVKWYLENSGHSVATASNGRAAVDKARDNHFDMILMDINMPILDGVGAVKEIRSFNSSVRIIGVTAHIDDELYRDSMRAGINQLMEKPLDYHGLVKALIGSDVGEHQVLRKQKKPDLIIGQAYDIQDDAILDLNVLDGHFTTLGYEKAESLYRVAVVELGSGLKVLLQLLADRRSISIGERNSEAANLAHKLAGLCSNFGLPLLEEILRHLELELSGPASEFDVVKLTSCFDDAIEAVKMYLSSHTKNENG